MQTASLLPLRPSRRTVASLPWICRPCLQQNAHQTRRHPQPAIQHARFSTSPRHLADSAPSHYEVLQLPQSASASDIKRQFYTLSKEHHPDRNPSDPTASTRFVAISEAYHTLSVPDKRAQYDLHISQTRALRWGRSASDHPQGSYSSASFAGSRPPSGLNKKRSTFRGPPPSFYKSGGYGRHGAKRGEYAHYQHAEAKAEQEAGQESSGGFEGFGPGQNRQGQEVPHFDDRRHKETHDHVNEYIYARRRMRASDAPEDIDRGGQIVSFLLVAGTVGLIGLTAAKFSHPMDLESNDKKHGA